jgi:hypothetical protein
MATEKTTIHQLMTRHLFGLIQPEEELELREALRVNPALQRLFNALRRSVDRFEHAPAICDWDLEQSFDQVMLEAVRKKNVNATPSHC